MIQLCNYYGIMTPQNWLQQKIKRISQKATRRVMKDGQAAVWWSTAQLNC